MKIYCPLHRKKIDATNITERIVNVGHGQRKMIEGFCPTHKIKVATFASVNALVPQTKSRTVRKKRRRAVDPLARFNPF